MRWLILALFFIGCDEGDVVVNNQPATSPADSTCDSTMVVPCEPETVWAPRPCPPDTVWMTDPFWECVKGCEEAGFNRNSRMYRNCMEDCLGEIE